MEISPPSGDFATRAILARTYPARVDAALNSAAFDSSNASGSKDDPHLREVFRDFVGQTIFSQMLRSMRRTLGKPAYFHGGKFEEVFQAELDRLIAEKAARKSGDTWAEAMYELFTLQLR
ncbi:MAG: hypothetical protein NZ899_05760 [Thermoguttaceae bacterium]|nr:hypothetical protein [Thermoguttaceae bacterium]MDW8079446.1 hypothetical protein [Thermoguttaceae bacterium]